MKATRMLDKDLHAAFMMGQEIALKRVAKAVKQHIERQDLPSLSGSPKASRKGGDSRHLIDTGAYLSSIKTWRSNYTYYVGVKSGLIEPKSRKEITKVAYWLEHGTKKIKARPVWGPTFKELGGTAALVEIVQQTIERFIKRRGW
jgi:hypothetical protein